MEMAFLASYFEFLGDGVVHGEPTAFTVVETYSGLLEH